MAAAVCPCGAGAAGSAAWCAPIAHTATNPRKIAAVRALRNGAGVRGRMVKGEGGQGIFLLLREQQKGDHAQGMQTL